MTALYKLDVDYELLGQAIIRVSKKLAAISIVLILFMALVAITIKWPIALVIIGASVATGCHIYFEYCKLKSEKT